jgi:hypothetical protein
VFPVRYALNSHMLFMVRSNLPETEIRLHKGKSDHPKGNRCDLNFTSPHHTISGPHEVRNGALNRLLIILMPSVPNEKINCCFMMQPASLTTQSLYQ